MCIQYTEQFTLLACCSCYGHAAAVDCADSCITIFSNVYITCYATFLSTTTSRLPNGDLYYAYFSLIMPGGVGVYVIRGVVASRWTVLSSSAPRQAAARHHYISLPEIKKYTKLSIHMNPLASFLKGSRSQDDLAIQCHRERMRGGGW